MKTIGLIGGVSWESTALYYKYLNEGVRERLGGWHSAKILMWSFDFQDIVERQVAGEWDSIGQDLICAARALEQAGADAIVIGSNTLHKVAADVQAAIEIPVIHVVDATAKAILARNVGRPALLATRYTMEQAFYKDDFKNKYGLQLLTPDSSGRGIIHQIIFEELCQGIITPQSRQAYRQELEKLVSQGADSVILGCTEIGMLLNQADVNIALFDTTKLHAMAALDFALQ